MLGGPVIMTIRSHNARDGASRLTSRCLMELLGRKRPLRAAGPAVKARETIVRSEIKIFCRTDRGACSLRAGPGIACWRASSRPEGDHE